MMRRSLRLVITLTLPVFMILFTACDARKGAPRGRYYAPSEADETILCEKCKGEGHMWVKCSWCEGSGKEECPDCDQYGRSTCFLCRGSKGIECNDCEGEGETVCTLCEGSGKGLSSSLCELCWGKGKLKCMACGASGFMVCDECGGKGYNFCYECKGQGTVVCTICSGEGVELKQCYLCYGLGRLRK